MTNNPNQCNETLMVQACESSYPKVSKERIAAILADSSFKEGKTGAKTALVTCTLPNGFEITETSACVHEGNYDQAMGVRICRERIEKKLWEFEGYCLASQIAGRNQLRADVRKGEDALSILSRLPPLT